MNTKAVVFTHCGGLKYESRESISKRHKELVDTYTRLLKPYLECKRDDGEPLIGVVYAYIDWAVVQAVNSSPNKRLQTEERNGEQKFQLLGELIEQDLQLKTILREAERNARAQLRLSGGAPPVFHYIGLTELIGLLDGLISVKPDMADMIHSQLGNFTYDSPKFVEAVIRLGRGDMPHLAGHPIIRVDEDARINAESICAVMDSFSYWTGFAPFFFFSCRYGREDDAYDVINDYAVRTHWFFKDAAGVLSLPPSPPKPGDRRYSDGTWAKEVELAEMFLSDLSVLGAAQPIRNSKHSLVVQSLFDRGVLKEQAPASSQVISGAALVMSRRSIELLPPFTNFGTQVTWIDDHLKRRLHEMLGDIADIDIETVVDGETEATIQQEREWFDERDSDPAKAWSWTKDYFGRLLRGCMLHAIITDSDGRPTVFSSMVREIAWFRVRQLDDAARLSLKAAIEAIALPRCCVVLDCWTSPEYKGTLSHEWASGVKSDSARQQKLVAEVVQGAIAYLELLLDWPAFTRTIIRMPFLKNDWLYEKI